MLLGLSLDHAPEHAVHIPDRRSQDVHSGGVYKLPRLLWTRKTLCKVGSRVVYFGAASDVPDLTLDQHRRIDRFQRFYSLLGLANILFDGQGRKIEDDRVKARLCGFEPLRERVRMIGVKKNREIEFLAQASNESCNLTSSHKLALSF